MKNSIYISAVILTFAAGLSLGVLAGQAPVSSADSKTSTRNRVVEPSGAMVHPADQKFMMDAAQGGMMEVQLGQAAQQKASSAAVKELGKKIEQDHTQAGNELESLAKSKNVSLPADAGAEKAMIDKMSTLSGAAFDKAYIKSMVRDHKKDVKEFEREAANGMDSDVKAFAAKTVPALREHLRMAEELQKNPAK